MRAVISDRFKEDATAKYQYSSYLNTFDADEDHETLTAFESVQGQSAMFGPSQNSIYQREVAQGASSCCPYGFCQERLQYYDLEDLEEIEKKMLALAAESSLGLQRAQARAAIGTKPHSNSNHSTEDAIELKHTRGSHGKEKVNHRDFDFEKIEKYDGSFLSADEDSVRFSDEDEDDDYDESIATTVKFIFGENGRMMSVLSREDDVSIRSSNVQEETGNRPPSLRKKSVTWKRAESKVEETFTAGKRSSRLKRLDSGAWFQMKNSSSIKFAVKDAKDNIAAEVNDVILKELNRGTNMAGKYRLSILSL